MKDEEKFTDSMAEAMDNEEEVETIVFEDQDGNEVEFIDIGSFDYEGKNYLALAPYDFMMGESKCASCENPDACAECEDGDGGLLYCEIVEKGEGEEELVPVNDDDLNDTLHAIFTSMMQEQMTDDGEDASDDKE